jgi:hypothetical protein
MKKKEIYLFVEQNYRNLSAPFIAERLGITTTEVYRIAHKRGLTKYKPATHRLPKPAARRLHKPDTRTNHSDEVPPPPQNENTIPLRIDHATIIFIPPDADPEERRKKFIEKLKSSRLNHHE